MLKSNDLLGFVDALLPIEKLGKKAVFTCDIEPDYGGRTGTDELLEDPKYLQKLAEFCREHRVPLSGFVVTSSLEKHPSLKASLQQFGLDVHAHSHTHETSTYQKLSGEEIAKSQQVFEQVFGRKSLGYRAPQGVLMPDDISALKKAGFAFSSSVFPAKRMGKFDLRHMPKVPWKWKEGVVEIPFGSTMKHKMVTVSYLKLFGWGAWKNMLSREDALPPIVVIDSHLHDFFVPSSFARLPLAVRLAYSRNKTQGFAYAEKLIQHLKEKGYEFCSVSDLFKLLINE